MSARHMVASLFAAGACVQAFSAMPASQTTPASPLVRTELIFEQAPFASAHASTIAAGTGGLVWRMA